MRFLEIGCGTMPLPNFEHLDIKPSEHIEYVCDASARLPFDEETFDYIFASHVLEHITHTKTLSTLFEWRRVLKTGCSIEIWVPDFRMLVQCYLEKKMPINGELCRTNEYEALMQYLSSKIYWGLHEDDLSDLHKAFFDEEYLNFMLIKAGFNQIIRMPWTQSRGHNHGLVNLGMRAFK